MSAIAQFNLIEIAKLDDLKKAAMPTKKLLKTIDNFFSYLNENSTELKEYPFSGYIYGTLLIYLEEQGIIY